MEHTNVTMRKMAWERTKGELAAILTTYDEDSQPQKDLEKAFSELIGEVEDCGIIDVQSIS